jgi:hypothetical protein
MMPSRRPRSVVFLPVAQMPQPSPWRERLRVAAWVTRCDTLQRLGWRARRRVFAAEITATDECLPSGTRGQVEHMNGDIWQFCSGYRFAREILHLHRTAFAITETIERPVVWR